MVLVDIGTGFYVEKVCDSDYTSAREEWELISGNLSDAASCARVLRTEGGGGGKEFARSGENCAGEAGEFKRC